MPENERSRGDVPRLPKRVEEELDGSRLAAEFTARARPLWRGGALRVPKARASAQIASALRSAHSAGQIVRGLEGAERALAAEQRGLSRVDRRTGVTRGLRVSRLLVLADDGAERFYRNAESLLHQHGPRVLALRLEVDERALGQLLFGADQVARLLLVEHKDAVSAVLLALAAQWRAEGARR